MSKLVFYIYISLLLYLRDERKLGSGVFCMRNLGEQIYIRKRAKLVANAQCRGS
jgi:hypothetical protein